MVKVGGRTCLEEVNYWECVLRMCIFPLLVSILFPSCHEVRTVPGHGLFPSYSAFSQVEFKNRTSYPQAETSDTLSQNRSLFLQVVFLQVLVTVMESLTNTDFNLREMWHKLSTGYFIFSYFQDLCIFVEKVLFCLNSVLVSFNVYIFK